MSDRRVVDVARLEHVTKHFPLPRRGFGARPRVHSADDVTLAIRSGEVLGLVGESGSGKSTLARLLLGLVRADTGRIEVDRMRVGTLGRADRRRLTRSAQLVFQDPHDALDPRMTLQQSLVAPMRQHRIGTAATRGATAAAALGEVGLDESFLARYPRDCSGGQLQRAVIARALLLEPTLLVCDEPTSALDASVRATILNLLLELHRTRELSVLLISHDLRVVEFLADRVAVLYLGQIVEVAPNHEVFGAGARHPYTLALLAARSAERVRVGGAAALRGEPPSPLSPPTGCRFSTRCPIAVDRCRTEEPPLAAHRDGHTVRCHRVAESRALLAAAQEGNP